MRRTDQKSTYSYLPNGKTDLLVDCRVEEVEILIIKKELVTLLFYFTIADDSRQVMV
jgi:hypothetical protein